LLEGKAPKAVVEEDAIISAKDQLYREQVEEYNVRFDEMFFCNCLSFCYDISRK